MGSATRKNKVMGNKVFVGGLSWDATDDDLKELFGECGTVTDGVILQDRETGRSRGFGFVTFSSDEEAKAAMRRHGVRLLQQWPSHSPDLNPQETVWAWAQRKLRKTEKRHDSLATFKRRIVDAARRYPSSAKLVPSMAHRVAKCLKRKGANLGM